MVSMVKTVLHSFTRLISLHNYPPSSIYSEKIDSGKQDNPINKDLLLGRRKIDRVAPANIVYFLLRIIRQRTL